MELSMGSLYFVSAKESEPICITFQEHWRTNCSSMKKHISQFWLQARGRWENLRSHSVKTILEPLSLDIRISL